MPIISRIGTKSSKVRLVYTAIFAVLIIGAISMIYPFMLMISGSMKSETDFVWISPLPRYLWDDDILWMKYVESKYTLVETSERAHRRTIGSWRKIQPPPALTGQDKETLNAFRAFREEFDWPDEWHNLGHAAAGRILAKNGRLYRKACQRHFGGGEEGVEAFSDSVGVRYNTWSQIGPPTAEFNARRFNFPQRENYRILYDLMDGVPKADWIPIDLDGVFWRTHVLPEWGTLAAYNAAHGTELTDYSQVLLSTRPPKVDQVALEKATPAHKRTQEALKKAEKDLREAELAAEQAEPEDKDSPAGRKVKQARAALEPARHAAEQARELAEQAEKPYKAATQRREDWQEYVRNILNVSFIRLDASAQVPFQDFLNRRYEGNIVELNRYWAKQYEDFSQIPLPKGSLRAVRAQVDLSAFVKDEEACPLDALSVYGPRQAFEDFVAARRDVAVKQVAPLPLPTRAVDYVDFQEQKGSLRWEFVKRNYITVIDYLLLHGNGIRNTVIYCGGLILVTLLVNPLAAYALSRYKLPSTYKILLFCMCTMAFPPEVTMIPAFLLMKRFPLYALIVGVGSAAVALTLLNRLLPKWPEVARGVLGVGLGVAAGYWLAPQICSAFTGQADANVSLLNTFFALILPRMANGYWIFLLKGFFDSLPRELYEAADLDGAGEWTKFWVITMNLSKPILAVMALGAFTAAYSEFMMALVIIPDQKMWTIMVWLYQLQASSHSTVVYASLIIAAIPTFLIFLFCQNIIMRGIIVPTEK